ncbi:hypothetical protein RJ639_039974 [Escallonia herrerae]|uniref:Beta-glucosidase n=1 Tax=Escallonia herrerae TaxID=1293975 RepID=A0AA89B5S7_9ASTE|nr:hypothetical protein RJ639_039974 [Escallonia herrerae]
MDPLVFGDYSHLMKSLIGARLLRFTAEQTHVTNFANDVVNVSYTTDNHANLTTSINGVPAGEKEGINLKGFFAWAIMDNFEWDSALTSRFGLNYVDFTGGLKRYPKLSAKWLTNFLKK